MQLKLISYLKDPRCLRIKIELSKLKRLPVELINHIVDDYVNNCCLYCKCDREVYGCYICKESDKCVICIKNIPEHLCDRCLRHSCSGRGQIKYCRYCDEHYCTGEKGCRSYINFCDTCENSYCNKCDGDEPNICYFCRYGW